MSDWRLQIEEFRFQIGCAIKLMTQICNLQSAIFHLQLNTFDRSDLVQHFVLVFTVAE
jgi:hypothetical protein